MLGKLFKHEFKDTAKLMVLIYGMFLAITLIGTLVLSNDAIQNSESTPVNIILAVLMIFYILSIFALFIITYVYMCIHFYKTMYSDQGYLTHTLPVKTSTIFHVKLLTSLVWMVCSMALMILSIFLLVIGASHGEIFSAEVAAELHQMSLEFEQDMGFPMSVFWIHMILCILLSCFTYLLWVFTSASVGQLFSQYKIVAAIVTGVVLYFVEQIISVIIMFTTGYTTYMTNTLVSADDTILARNFMGNMLTATYIFSITICVIYYIVCRIIMKKHLNLE